MEGVRQEVSEGGESGKGRKGKKERRKSRMGVLKEGGNLHIFLNIYFI